MKKFVKCSKNESTNNEIVSMRQANNNRIFKKKNILKNFHWFEF